MKSGTFTNFIPHGVHEINPNPYKIESAFEIYNEKKKKKNAENNYSVKWFTENTKRSIFNLIYI